ncbi:cell division protein ZapE [Salmonella enterica]|nr:cell division protein ZapE [Salmonella enterica]
MQSLSPTSRYLQALNEGTHQPDDVQKEAVNRLETLYQELIVKKTVGHAARRTDSATGEIIRQKRTGRANTGSRAVHVGGAWGAAKPGSWISSTTACRASENCACIFIVLCCACMKNLPRYRDRAIR